METNHTHKILKKKRGQRLFGDKYDQIKKVVGRRHQTENYFQIKWIEKKSYKIKRNKTQGEWWLSSSSQW